jgi:malate/lactate dehydrogenase
LFTQQIGTGKVRRSTAYATMHVELAKTLTVCDVKSSLVAAFAEELKQITMNKGLTVEITACERDEQMFPTFY